jgi:hypothetical protein
MRLELANGKLDRVYVNARMARRMRGLDYSENYIS